MWNHSNVCSTAMSIILSIQTSYSRGQTKSKNYNPHRRTFKLWEFYWNNTQLAQTIGLLLISMREWAWSRWTQQATCGQLYVIGKSQTCNNALLIKCFQILISVYLYYLRTKTYVLFNILNICQGKETAYHEICSPQRHFLNWILFG